MLNFLAPWWLNWKRGQTTRTSTPHRKRSASRSRHWRSKEFHPCLEQLEERIMLDNGLPAAIVVGRTLSAYDVPDVQHNQLTITYTVYNEQADDETGVLLTDTLKPGVTFQTASQLPDQNGQQLAFSLGTIHGFDRASVTLTVGFAGPIPTQLDTGAVAFATLDAGAVSNTTPAAMLRTTAIAANLLASTPDANTTDPFMQEQAAKLNYDPVQIFNFLHTQIGYNSYTGSVRGARGTLWSNAGNALDVASLGVALMRASGFPAQYVSGTLTQSQAQQVILSMFPASFQTVGYLPAGTQAADPANDSQLLGETESHYWFQFDAGTGMKDADPLMAGASIGQTFTASAGMFSDVPDNLREKTEVKLTAEIYGQASAAFGIGHGLSQTVVLDQTFNDVDLVGHPLAIGNFVSSTAIGALAGSVTNSYSPYIQVGDVANSDPSTDPVIVGKDYQEVLTDLPLGNQVLTGLFLDITLSGPTGAAETDQRTLFDRLGPAARLGQTTPNIVVDPNALPSISNFDIATVNVLPGLFPPQRLSAAFTELQAIDSERTSLAALVQANGGSPTDAITQQGSTLFTRFISVLERSLVEEYAIASDATTAQLAATSLGIAYSDRPRITIASSHFEIGTTSATLDLEMDLRRDDLRFVLSPGQTQTASFAFFAARGILNNALEGNVLAGANGPGTTTVVSTTNIFQAANAKGIGIVALTQQNAGLLDQLAISANAKALITQALANNEVVFVPAQSPIINGKPLVGWFQTNLATGETIDVLEDGNHAVESNTLRAAFKGVETRLTSYATGYVPGFLAGVLVTLSGYIVIGVSIATGDFAPVGVGGLVPALPGAGLIIGALIREGLKRLGTILPAKSDFLKGAIQGYVDATGVLLKTLTGAPQLGDPSAEGLLFGVQLPALGLANQGNTSITEPATRGTGTLSGTLEVPGIAISGPMTASWTSTAINSFSIQSLSAIGASVADANGSILGTGTITLSGAKLIPSLIAGNVRVDVTGQGSLSFYGAAANSLGVGGNWENYTASVTGTATITVVTDSLMLNGTLLPAGHYTITANAMTVSGNGATSSPNFSGAVSITATASTVDLGPAMGSVTVGGNRLDLRSGSTLTGFTGTIAVTPGSNNLDAVRLEGNAANVITVSATPAGIVADQNTARTFQVQVNTSLSGSYTLSVIAPLGWTATIDNAGKVTVTPAAGLQGGTYSIQIIAQSTTNPDLVAQTTVNVTITPTTPGITLAVQPDPQFTVPFQGIQVPTGFDAVIQNTGPAADTFSLTLANLPSGFTVQDTGTSVTIPAGQPGLLGIYLLPSGNQLPAPGTQVSFSVTATSTTNPAITQTQLVTFTFPSIDGITLTGSPTVVNTTPGSSTTATLTVTNVGNVPETVTLSSTQPTALTLSGLTPISLHPGESQQESVTIAPDASTPLNSLMDATITGSFGPANAPVIQTLDVLVDVVAPGALAIANASSAALQTGNGDLANRLNDLSTAITSFEQSGFTSAINLSQILAALDAVIALAKADPLLAPTTPALSTVRTETANASSPAEYTTAFTDLGNGLTALTTVLLDEATHNFTLSLTPSSAQAILNAAVPFNVSIQNAGSQTTTYDLSISGLPANATAVFKQNGTAITKVTLQPGQAISGGANGISVAITETGGILLAGTFTVTATAEGAAEITHNTQGKLTVPASSIAVAEVDANPPFIQPGPGNTVDVVAKLAATLSSAQSDQGFYTVADSNGTVIFTSSLVPVNLVVQGGFQSFDLGSFPTTGLADGFYTITVTITDSTGTPLPGVTGLGTVEIGSPLSATIGLETDLTRTISGITTTVSSTFPFSSPNGAIDGNLNTIWAPARGDAVNQGGNPFFEIDFPTPVVVNRVELYGPRSDFRIDPENYLVGHVTLFDATGNTLFDTGPITLNIGTFLDGVASFANVANVSKVRFTSTTDIGLDPELAEFRVLGPLQNLTAGTVSVTTPLQIDAQLPLTSPLTLLGSVSTTPTARSLALYAPRSLPGTTLTYLPGNTAIDIVDVSNPAAPIDLGSFGSGDIIGGGLALARIATIADQAYLVVASSVTLNASGFSLLIYSLANPLAPTLVSKTTLNDGGLFSDMLIDGTTVLLPTQYITVFGVFGDQGGTVAAIDLSNPAAPVNEGLLFSNKTAAFGGGQTGDTNQIGGALVNSNLAYMGSSTSVGDHPSVGEGRILIVDTSTPSNLQLTGSMELDVPGTVHIISVALDPTDHRALLVGTSGGWTSISPSNTNGLGGTLTLSTVDTTDPLHPVLLGTATTSFLPHFTAFTDDHGAPGAVYLGNHLFAVAGEDSITNTPVLLIVDINNPANPVVASVPFPAMSYELAVKNGDLYVSSADGLTIYQINGLPSISYTAAIKVPKNTVVAGALALAPATLDTSNPNFDVINVSGTFSNRNTAANLSFQSLLSDVSFNQIVPVTLGTTIRFVSHGTAGTLTLPGTNLPAFHILEVTPSTQMGTVDTASSYNVHLTNPTSNDVDYTLTVSGVPAGWVNLSSDFVFVPANSSQDVTLQLTPDATAQADNLFTVTADDGGGLKDSAAADLTVTPTPVDPESHGIVATLIPITATAGQGTSAVYTVQLTNTGSADNTFKLDVAGLPAGVAFRFMANNQVITTVDVPPGVSNFRDVSLVMTPAAGTPPAPYPFMVTAASTKPVVMGSTAGTLTVVNNGVAVTLDPPSGPPGSTFHLTVTNTGTVTDTFDLAVGSPAGLVASLGTSAVTLAAGASQVVTITTRPVNFALPGSLDLTGIATSRGNRAVRASATSALTIPVFHGLTAEFTPASQALAAPGKATFLLTVHNTGNTEDAYTADLTGTSGPLSADIMGLDGLPTQQIPTFRLPALSTGAILVQADLTDFGQGTATVQVQSQNDPLRTTTNTATVRAFAATPSPTPSPTPETPSPAIHYIAVGADAGGAPEVKVFDADTGALKLDFLAYPASFTGGVRVAVGDVNGDGIPDIITGTGPGAGGGEVKVFDGRDGSQLYWFFAFEPGFTGGIFVAAGDVNGDGTADIVVGKGAGSMPEVKVFGGGAESGRQLYWFLAYDAAFQGGVTVAAGDVNGDGCADVITGTAFGTSHVKVFGGGTLAGEVLQSFFAFNPLYIGGVYVAAGDVNGDGKADVVVGSGGDLLGSGPHVRVLSGVDGTELASMVPFNAGFVGGARVAAVDRTSDGAASLVIGAGPLGGPEVRMLDGLALTDLDSFFAYDLAFRGGVFVAGG